MPMHVDNIPRAKESESYQFMREKKNPVFFDVNKYLGLLSFKFNLNMLCELRALEVWV